MTVANPATATPETTTSPQGNRNSTKAHWEYRIESSASLDSAQALLNQCGSEGWELVSVIVPTTPDSGPVKTLRARRDTNFQLFLKRCR